jgi:hypothetical protein
MRDIEHRRTLEAVQNSRVYDLLSAAIGPRKKSARSVVILERGTMIAQYTRTYLLVGSSSKTKRVF